MRELTDEQKARMAEGRRRAAEAKRASASVPVTVEHEKDDFEERLDNILTNEEVLAIYAAAKQKRATEKKEARKREIMDQAMLDARRKDGDVPFDEEHERFMAELVQVPIDMPRLRMPNGGEAPPPEIILDGMVFTHGRTVTVTRAVADTLYEIMGRQWMHVAQVDGRVRTHYNSQLGRTLLQGGYAGGLLGGGAAFDRIHRRPD